MFCRWREVTMPSTSQPLAGPANATVTEETAEDNKTVDTNNVKTNSELPSGSNTCETASENKTVSEHTNDVRTVETAQSVRTVESSNSKMLKATENGIKNEFKNNTTTVVPGFKTVDDSLYKITPGMKVIASKSGTTNGIILVKTSDGEELEVGCSDMSYIWTASCI